MATIKVRIPLDPRGVGWLQIEAENVSQLSRELVDVGKRFKELHDAAQNLIRTAAEGIGESPQ